MPSKPSSKTRLCSLVRWEHNLRWYMCMHSFSGGSRGVQVVRSNPSPPPVFSSPEPKAQVELIVWDSSRRPSVRASVRTPTLSNINITETSWPIINKFHQKHYWGGGLAASGFGLDRIRTLVSIATDSSHRVIMRKTL